MAWGLASRSTLECRSGGGEVQRELVGQDTHGQLQQDRGVPALPSPHLARVGRRGGKHAQLLLGRQRRIDGQHQQRGAVGVGGQGCAALADQPLAGLNLLLSGEEHKDVAWPLVAVHLGCSRGEDGMREGASDEWLVTRHKAACTLVP